MHAHRGAGATGNGPRKEVCSGSGTANVLGRGKSRRVLYRGRDAAEEATRPDPAATGGFQCCSPLATRPSPKCWSPTHSCPASVQHRRRCQGSCHGIKCKPVAAVLGPLARRRPDTTTVPSATHTCVDTWPSSALHIVPITLGAQNWQMCTAAAHTLPHLRCVPADGPTASSAGVVETCLRAWHLPDFPARSSMPVLLAVRDLFQCTAVSSLEGLLGL